MNTITHEDLGFVWSSCRVTDNDSCQYLVHHAPTQCIAEFFKKLLDTGKVASKLYILFHLIPLIMRLRKVKSPQDLGLLLLRSAKEYGRSICFMSFLVGLLRLMLCVNWNLKQQHVIRPWISLFSYMSPLSAVSILFEDQTRRNQIGYHVCAKALRSVYMIAKRLWGWEWGSEAVAMHMGVMALLYYVFNHHPNILKFRNVFELIFGSN